MSRLPASWLSGANDELTIRSITATLVSVPLRRALGTSIMRIPESPLLLIDLVTEEGITGRTCCPGPG
ncbi:hypothetical protein [Streptomyces sp. NPDC002619]|uniref:hypothetical protein n=1 Tax=Streptomyces sp. NPDC002619 TaxID=3364655 RepID=UPI0036D15C80